MSKALTTKALYLAGLAGCLLTLGTVRADAGLIGLSISTLSFSSPDGGSGTFDVTLTNTGVGAVSIGGFEFHISTTNPGITFTGANMSTSSPYIFGFDSLDAALAFSFTTQTGTALDASDNPFSVASYSIPTGTTVGLGHVSYLIAGNAATGPFSITLDPTSTLLSDANGNNITVDQLNSGAITVTNSAPEPATFALAGLVLAAAMVMRQRKLRTAQIKYASDI